MNNLPPDLQLTPPITPRNLMTSRQSMNGLDGVFVVFPVFRQPGFLPQRQHR
jgi:hypothetical protein